MSLNYNNLKQETKGRSQVQRWCLPVIPEACEAEVRRVKSSKPASATEQGT